jgi:hypothetical protein
VVKFIGALVVSMSLCAMANAGNDRHDNDFNNFGQHNDYNQGKDWNDRGGDWRGHPIGAPEIDPASALSGLTLLGAGLAVIRGRRTKK